MSRRLGCGGGGRSPAHATCRWRSCMLARRLLPSSSPVRRGGRSAAKTPIRPRTPRALALDAVDHAAAWASGGPMARRSRHFIRCERMAQARPRARRAPRPERERLPPRKDPAPADRRRLERLQRLLEPVQDRPKFRRSPPDRPRLPLTPPFLVGTLSARQSSPPPPRPPLPLLPCTPKVR